jgi:hypothetical protein
MLIQEYIKAQSIPPWTTRKKYGKLVRDLAEQAIWAHGGIPDRSYQERGI